MSFTEDTVLFVRAMEECAENATRAERERIFRTVEKRLNWLGVEKFKFVKGCIYDEL